MSRSSEGLARKGKNSIRRASSRRDVHDLKQCFIYSPKAHLGQSAQAPQGGGGMRFRVLQRVDPRALRRTRHGGDAIGGRKRWSGYPGGEAVLQVVELCVWSAEDGSSRCVRGQRRSAEAYGAARGGGKGEAISLAGACLGSAWRTLDFIGRGGRLYKHASLPPEPPTSTVGPRRSWHPGLCCCSALTTTSTSQHHVEFAAAFCALGC